MKKGVLALLGFIIFFSGMLGLILSLVGVEFIFFHWLGLKGFNAFILQLIMIVGGNVLIALDLIPANPDKD